MSKNRQQDKAGLLFIFGTNLVFSKANNMTRSYFRSLERRGKQKTYTLGE